MLYPYRLKAYQQMTVILAQALQTSIFQHLQGTYPNEGGGFLLGSIEGDAIRIGFGPARRHHCLTDRGANAATVLPTTWGRSSATRRGSTARLEAAVGGSGPTAEPRREADAALRARLRSLVPSRPA